MKRVIVTLAFAFALAFTASAWAGQSTYAYTGPWWPNQAFGSSFSSSWWQNVMSKQEGFISTVAFIDNVTYGWHVTVRNASHYTETHWFSSQVKKAHCRANEYTPRGASCTVFN
jgi:hypothetical protein